MRQNSIMKPPLTAYAYRRRLACADDPVILGEAREKRARLAEAARAGKNLTRIQAGRDGLSRGYEHKSFGLPHSSHCLGGEAKRLLKLD